MECFVSVSVAVKLIHNVNQINQFHFVFFELSYHTVVHRPDVRTAWTVKIAAGTFLTVEAVQIIEIILAGGLASTL